MHSRVMVTGQSSDDDDDRSFVLTSDPNISTPGSGQSSPADIAAVHSNATTSSHVTTPAAAPPATTTTGSGDEPKHQYDGVKDTAGKSAPGSPI